MSRLQHLPTYNAPMALDDKNTRTKAFQPEDARGRMAENAKEAHEYVLGPMPIQDFLDEFLPEGRSGARAQQMLSSKSAFAAVPVAGSSAGEVHGPLLAALSKATKHKARCPGFIFADVPSKVGLSKHTIACYALATPPVFSPDDYTPSTALGFAELLIHVNADPSQDPFVDSRTSTDGRPFLSAPKRAEMGGMQRTLGHHIDLISELLARQYREHVFSISVCGSKARFFRWDRAGGIATESFDLHDSPNTLCEFLWRFSQASAEGRGHDLSVQPALPEEEELFKNAVTRRVQHELELSGEKLLEAVSEHYAPGRVVVIQVITTQPGSNVRSVRRFIVSRPVVSPSSLTGRCTRGLWAVDASTGEVGFVKDTWRSSDVEAEGAVISHLLSLGVRNVPELVCHGDVEFDGRVRATTTDEYQHLPWYIRPDRLKDSLAGQVHYRVVLGTVGYGLSRFKGTEELLHGTYDAFQAMRDAMDKDSRLHRDISLGNIILVRNADRTVRRGYLIDWEVSSRVDSGGQSLDHSRVGTWYFMSWKVLMHRKTVHTLEDDMESLIWIVLYCALRWLPHDAREIQLPTVIEELFVKSSLGGPSGFIRGGDAKLANVFERQYTNEIAFDSPVQAWLATAMDYHHPPPERAQELEGRWTDPNYLDVFWSRFLSSQRLPSHDRYEHDIDPDDECFVPLTASIVPASPCTSPKNSEKRGSPVAEDEGPGSPKKRRKQDDSGQNIFANPAPAPRSRARQGSKASGAKRPTRAGRPLRDSGKAVSAEPRYFLRAPSEVVSKYRRAHSR